MSLHSLCKSGEAQWLNGWCAGLRIERSRFEPCVGHCVVFLGRTVCSYVGLLP